MASNPGDPLGVGAPPIGAGASLPGRIGLPDNAVSVVERDQDLGRGPGTRGGGQAGRKAVGVAPRGTVGGRSSGGGYTQEDLAALLAGTPAEKLAMIQRQMQAAGLIGATTRYTVGQPDKVTVGALEELMGIANVRASSWENILAGLQNPGAIDQERAAQAAASLQGRLNTYEATDPASVRQTAEAAFRQALGRKPKKDELEKFVSNFLGSERASQQQVFDAQDRLEQRNRAAAEGAVAAAASGETGGSESDILWNRLQRMIADAPGKITPGKRSRDYATQVKLWNDYQAGRGPMAARPGTSKHGDGRANDLKYENDYVRKWALENAHKYGLAFPIYNPKLGRGRDESWHVEVAAGSLPPGHSVGDGHNHGAATGASMSENVVVQRQDLGAQAVEYARNVNPDETAAYEIGGQFNNLLAILSKGVV